MCVCVCFQTRFLLDTVKKHMDNLREWRYIGAEKPMTATDRRDRILRCFLCPDIGQVSPHFRGHFLTKLHRKPGEKGQKIHRRKFKKSSGEGAPKLQMNLSLVVVESAPNIFTWSPLELLLKGVLERTS